MVKLLKKRVMVTSMVVVTILLIGVFLALNIANTGTMNSQADKLLAELTTIYSYNPDSVSESSTDENDTVQNVNNFIKYIIQNPDGTISNVENSDFNETESTGETAEAVLDETETETESSEYIDEGNQPVPHDGSEAPSPFMSFLLQEVNANDILGAVYYTVVIGTDGHINNVDIERVADVSRKQATDTAWSVYTGGSDSGWTGSYKYTVAKDPSEKSVYIFLNMEKDLNNNMRIVILSAAILIVTWILLFLLEIALTNRLVRPVAENMEKQKQFITDAGHEIKTPLAIIQANTEALEVFNGENKWTNNIKTQTMRLSNLMTNMLTLAKAEEMAGAAIPVDVDISQICTEYIEMFNEPAAKRNITIIDNMESGLTVQGNRNQYGQLISILLDNAIKYSDEMTEITLDSVNKDKNVVLIMTNIATSIPDCEPEMLFNRFYRPESSRYYYSTGNGIGLSSAKVIAEMYGGTITCRFEYGNKMVFTVTFKK